MPITSAPPPMSRGRSAAAPGSAPAWPKSRRPSARCSISKATWPPTARNSIALFGDGETVPLGDIAGRVLFTPGHTPACACYVFGDAAFVGDTLFMPDSGTARADFPGGSADALYDSLHRILCLPAETRLFMCHDYGAGGQRGFAWETTVAEQRRSNIHCRDGVSRESFVAARTARDAELPVPRLMVPAVQVNIRGGRMPAPEDNGYSYLKVPIDVL